MVVRRHHFHVLLCSYCSLYIHSHTLTVFADMDDLKQLEEEEAKSYLSLYAVCVCVCVYVLSDM
jgi:hypothetical protein